MEPSSGSRLRREDHQIVPGVRGWLESPRADAAVSDCLLLSGWAFAAGGRIVGLQAKGFGSSRPIPYGLRRDDVASVYDDEPNASHSGFSVYLEIDSGPADPSHVEVWATLDDGRSIRLFRRRLTHHGSGVGARLWNAAQQAMRHPRLLLSGRSWLNALALIAQGAPPARPPSAPSVDARAAFAQAARAFLENFLAAGSRLALAASPSPVVSVVVVVWNRAELTLQCLRALAAQSDVATEVIVVDNASTDETPELLARVDGVRVIRNAGNLGFTVAVNLGAKAARGEFLLLLNNDAELLPGSLRHLLQTARRSDAIGAVGGKLVSPDGRLQEAGSIAWSDGSCDAYGRGGDPTAPEFNFERQVDFCSAALVLTPRDLFERLGGFDERYKPAYYEDADYCATLWTHGFRVMYQPKAVAIHYEFGSSTSAEAAVQLQRERRPLFASKHAPWLSSQLARTDGVFAARSHPHGQPSVIVIDDVVPDPRMGAGFPRAAALLQALADLGYLITLYTTGEGDGASMNVSVPCVEVVAGGPSGLREFLVSGRHPRVVIVSRPHNMQYVKAAIGSDLSVLGAPCVYDAEAIFASREIGRRALLGQPLTEAEDQALLDREIALARGCAAVLAVSEPERQVFEQAGVPNVRVVGHAVDARPTPNAFERRETILFVGAFGPDSPNDDTAAFFCRDVLPALRDAGCHAPLVVAGARISEQLKSLGDSSVSWQADVDDLTPFYDDARVFVAPTRFGAGIPLKVVEAAARGVPVVSTPLVVRQLGWKAGTELLTAERADDFAHAVASLFVDRQLWTRLREAALARVARDYSPSMFRSGLQQALKAAGVAERRA